MAPGGRSFPARTSAGADRAGRFTGSLFGLSPGTTLRRARDARRSRRRVRHRRQTASAHHARRTRFAEPSLQTLYVSPRRQRRQRRAPARCAAAAHHRSARPDLAAAGRPGAHPARRLPGGGEVTVSGTAGQPIVFRGNGPGAVLDGADAALARRRAPGRRRAAASSPHVLGFPTGHVVTRAADASTRYTQPRRRCRRWPPGRPAASSSTGHDAATSSSPTSSLAGRAHDARGAASSRAFLVDGARPSSGSRTWRSATTARAASARGSTCAESTRLPPSASCRIHEVGNRPASGSRAARGTGSRTTRSGTRRIFGWPWDLVKGSSRRGQRASTFTDDRRPQGHVVRRNTLRGFFNGFVPCGSRPSPGDHDRDRRLRQRRCRSHLTTRFEPEGHCANVRIFENRIRDVHMAVRGGARRRLGPT